MRKIKMIGQSYGRLIVVEERGREVKAVCTCNTVKWYLRSNVLAGYTKSCGCFRNGQQAAVVVTHGMSRTATYTAWKTMKSRCDNYMRDNFERYGGRGITYDPAWAHFENFLQDMGEKPEGLELDRIDNNGNYCKANCRWVTHQVNCQNRGY